MCQGNRAMLKYGEKTGWDFPHYLNNGERKEFVRLCQKSGMTQEELRSKKEYRVLLSKAQNFSCGAGCAIFISLRYGYIRYNSLKKILKAKARRLAETENFPLWGA